MAILQLREIGDPVLKKKAVSVHKVSQRIKNLLQDMTDTMYAAEGVGLAAPQVGISKRVIVVDIGEGLLQLVNPVLVWRIGEETATEGCLSVPDVVGEVTRAKEVLVRGLNAKGRKIELKAAGLLARALQHEMDHLDGILFIDKAVDVRRIVKSDREERDGLEKGGS